MVCYPRIAINIPSMQWRPPDMATAQEGLGALPGLPYAYPMLNLGLAMDAS